MASKKTYLSKSRYTQGLQCLKRLWLQVNSPEIAAPPDERSERTFAIGHAVGKLAHKLFPGGILIEEDHQHLAEAIQSTKKAAEAGAAAMFEATVSYRDVLCRADVLQRVAGRSGKWDLFEVKSTSKVKDEHIPDVAVQRYCLEGAGYPVRKAHVMHVDTEYVRRGDIDVKKLFTPSDQTESSQEHLAVVERNIREQLAVLAGAKAPEVKPGPQCTKPYECPFMGHCISDSGCGCVDDLMNGWRSLPALREAGITTLADIPDGFKLTPVQMLQVESARKHKPVKDEAEIKRFLDGLEFPLYFLDFETAASAIPFFDDCRPWQAIPFQMSLHTQSRAGAIGHKSYLAAGRIDPRPALVEAMLDAIGPKGTVLVWHQSTEKGIIDELAKLYPKQSQRLLDINSRVQDLMDVFRKGWYMDWRFRGSWSLKAVVPVLVPKLDYADLEVQDGTVTSARAEKFLSGDMSEKDWQANRKALLEYCGRDTETMVEIVGKLGGILAPIPTRSR